MRVIAISVGLALTVYQGAVAQVTAPPSLSGSAQRAILYEEDSSNSYGKKYVGTARWNSELVSSGIYVPGELAVRLDVEIAERHLWMNVLLRRNNDKSLPASHTIEIQFPHSSDINASSIGSVPGLLMKTGENTRGVPLAGLAVKVSDDYYLIGLSKVPGDVARNETLLRGHPWIDIPIVYANGRRAIIAVEKGEVGGIILTNVFNSWATSNQTQPRQDDSAEKKRLRLAELEDIELCEQLPASKAYFVAVCIVRGMEQSRQLDGLQDAKTQVESVQAGLNCTPAALSNLQQKSARLAAKILNSGVISKLMDFADAMTLECKKGGQLELRGSAR
jgi:hypothetical protein